MLSTLPRRQRFLALAGGGALLFVAVTAGVVVFVVGGGEDRYVPGEELEGLTSTLARELPPDHPTVTFTDVSRAAGIDFRHFPGRRTTRLPEDMGSGAAWGDYDGDGWLDLFVANEAGPLTLTAEEVAASPGHDALFHNRGDGTFEEVAEAAGVARRGTDMGAAWGDYDGDGWPDLFVTSWGGLALYRNRGDGTFEDVTTRAGLGGWEGFWAGVSWADYDVDGDLDAYVTGYVRWEEREASTSLQYDTEQPTSLNPSAFDPERNLLFRNEGDGTFTEVAAEAGVLGDRGRSLSAAWADLDEDGWPDLYVANDVSDNALFLNRGDGTFEEVSHEALVADYRGAMGIAVGDWNGDADLDLFLTHWMAQENALFNSLLRDLSTGPDTLLRFIDEADRYGLGQSALDYVGWGTSFFDYDNDGRLDLLVVNGSTLQEDEDPTLLIPMPDQLLWNGGPDRGFFDVSSVAGPWFQRRMVGRGAAFGDYDNDGDEDVFIVNHGAPGVLLRNDGGTGHHWLQVELEGTTANRSAVGARVRVVVGGRGQVREVGAQPSYLSQDSPVQHFGLGTATAVDSLVVRWPGGERQTFTDLPVDRRVRLVQGGAPEMRALPHTGASPAGGGGRGGPDAVGAGGPPTGGAAGPEDRAAVRAFWETFRQATTDRIAGRLEAAAAGYRRALELDPAHEDALYYLGAVLSETGHPDGARAAWERLTALNPRSARAHASLGVLALCEAEGPEGWKAAEEAIHRAADINREETGLRLRLAEAALLRGDTADARTALDAVLGSNPRSGPALFLSGFLAWRRGRREAATRAFRRALEAPGAAADALASGEGDTRTGADHGGRPAACPAMLGAALESEAPLSDAEDAAARADAAYRALEARLEGLGGG